MILIKNIILFIPATAGHQLLNPGVLINCIMGFFSFSFVASGIYIINDIIDLKLPGGGGHGDPLKRSKKLIDDDFNKGYCTKKYIIKNYK